MSTERLRSDHERLTSLAARSVGVLSIDRTVGSPPREYYLTLRCRGLAGMTAAGPRFIDEHRVQITLAGRYPFDEPTVRFITPILHPHIWAHENRVCLGTWRSTEFLDALVERLFGIVQYDPELLDPSSIANAAAQRFLSSGDIRPPLGTVVPGRPVAAVVQAPARRTITFTRTR